MKFNLIEKVETNDGDDDFDVLWWTCLKSDHLLINLEENSEHSSLVTATNCDSSCLKYKSLSDSFRNGQSIYMHIYAYT